MAIVPAEAAHPNTSPPAGLIATSVDDAIMIPP